MGGPDTTKVPWNVSPPWYPTSTQCGDEFAAAIQHTEFTKREVERKGPTMNSKTTEMTEAVAAAPTGAQTVTEHEREEVSRANATGLQPVVFVHGLLLLPSTWDPSAGLFE